MRLKIPLGSLPILLLCFGRISATPLDDATTTVSSDPGDSEAISYLEDLDKRYGQACNKMTETRWDYITNVTDERESASIAAQNEFNKFQSDVQLEIHLKFPNWKEIQNPDIRRQFQHLSIQGPNTMEKARVDEMNLILSGMEAKYAKARVCEYKNPTKCDLRLEPEITEKIKSSKDFETTAHYWTAWHDAISDAVRPQDYTKFVKLQNEMAKANGFNDMSEMWAMPYDDGSPDWTPKKFKDEMKSIWAEIKPHYQKLHTYVRINLYDLSKKFSKWMKRFGYLPASMLGNIWAQDWTGIETLVKPYQTAPSLDASSALKEKDYTPVGIFKEADKFFEEMGLLKMTDTFWKKSMLERPDDGRTVVCHASAEDFCTGKGNTDFRIKQCTVVNMDHLVTAHHEMGHIEYFMQYTNLTYVYRTGANPGFHEAIGDSLALAVSTPKHLQCALKLDMGLGIDCNNPKGGNEVTETDINFLFRMALEKFAFFPFAIAMDSWRWEVFEGVLKEEDYNTRWWELRKEIQGVVPPYPRDPKRFDPAAKYHIVANVEYIRYFISHILQFSFYEAMCINAGEYNPNDPNTKPLFKCDFSGSKKAGEKLGDMMKVGFSKPWPEALEILTGSRKMSTRSLFNYFEPLFKKIDEDLKKAGEPACFGADCEAHAREFLRDYDAKELKLCNNASVTSFAHYIDTTNKEKEELSKATSLASALFSKEAWMKNFSQYNWKDFKDTDLRRQFKLNAIVGVPALSDKSIERFDDITTEMSKIYAQGKICPYAKKENCDLEKEGLSLNPDLEEILTKHESYDDMAYAWNAWRNATGRKMRQLYYEYVDLSNEAAKANDFKNMGDLWINGYESDDFRGDMERIWLELKDMYAELHAYVRFKLSKKFKEIDPNGPLPAHVFGNMWAQSWDNILPHIGLPFPDVASFDVTPALKKKYPHTHEGVYQMFEVANEFFTSLGLFNMSVAYGEKAMIIKPTDGRVPVCHASAWDFCDQNDYRIKMCTNINMEDFITIHHELGHIQYDMNYKDLPLSFRGGANPGFHEAIGDVISLSVSTPKHMMKLGLIKDMVPSEKSRINYLMKKAFEKIAFLPFGYLIDNYRWDIFSGATSRDTYTHDWLKLRTKYQGIVPPFVRTEQDFDAGAKYHIPSDTAYIRYFVSAILQFQVHKALCTEAGEYPASPLDSCDIYQNKKAGEKFKKILAAGQSRPWQDILYDAIGERHLSASAIKEYFRPLIEYLQKERQTHSYPIGWDEHAFEKLYRKE